MLLSKRVAIITGGARGIGKGIALKFAGEGCSVVIADILEAEAQETIKEITDKGVEGIFARCDVTNSRMVQDMVHQAIAKFGKVDILVNNAGVGPEQNSIVDVSEEDWDRVLGINLKGVFLCCKAVVPYMIKEKHGKIINISSLAAFAPDYPYVHYCASKAGILGLTYDLAFELSRHKIYVNAICPGPILTPLWSSRLPSDANKKEEALAQIVRHDGVPLQRFGSPEDVAGVALFLASDLSSYITGEKITAAGGLPLKILPQIS